MAGSINDFKSSFTKDLAKTSKFDVQFAIPFDVQNSSDISSPQLSLRCEVSQLPSRNIQLVEQKIYGATEKYGVQSTYEDITFTFYCTDGLKEKQLFDNWLEYINPTPGLNGGAGDWNFKYKNTYCQDIFITQYGLDNSVSQVITLIDAFPHTMSAVELSWSDENPLRVSVTFAYHYWTASTTATTYGVDNVPLPQTQFATPSSPTPIPVNKYSGQFKSQITLNTDQQKAAGYL